MSSLKRADSGLAPIPAKSARLGISTNVAVINKPPRFGTNNSTTNTNNVIKRVGGQNMKPTTARSDTATTKKTTAVSTSSATTGAGKPINKRIPPYDFKARYNDLLEKHKILKERFENKNEQLLSYENLPEQLEETQSELIRTQNELKNTQTIKQCLEGQVKMQHEKLESLEASLSQTKEELHKLTIVYNVSKVFLMSTYLFMMPINFLYIFINFFK